MTAHSPTTTDKAFTIRQRRRRLGFSLIELLTVMAVLATGTALLVPAFSSLTRSHELSSEGNKLMGIITRASQNSVARNAMTALVAIPSDSASSSDLDTFALFQYAAGDSAWQQITKWETMKDGIVLDPDHLALTDYPAIRPAPDLPDIVYQGSVKSSFKYVIFLPDRSLLRNDSAQISLAEGNFVGGGAAPTFTRPKDGGPASYYRITILAATGRPIIDRP